MPPAETTVTAETRLEKPADAISEMCVVDLGEHSKKSIKKLRHGEGRLMDKVEDAILSLREEGILGASSQAVVIVVREETSFESLFDDDDDDDDDDD
ncbi:MAG: hypothetical protein KIS73_13125 [Enhydrobacter sp.]|nr:hypothetical protein [Enhydrobacter sp.]